MVSNARSWKRQEGSSPGDFRGSRALPAKALILDFPSPERERRNFCCFKPPSLWLFVTAAPGEEYKPLSTRWQKANLNQF